MVIQTYELCEIFKSRLMIEEAKCGSGHVFDNFGLKVINATQLHEDTNFTSDGPESSPTIRLS